MSARNLRTARDAGTRFETLIAAYLREKLNDDRIERRARSGAKDRGDIGGLRRGRGRIVVECKDAGGRYAPGPWLAEAEVERGNDDAVVGLVIAKRPRKVDAADQLVLMTVRDLVALLTGARP